MAFWILLILGVGVGFWAVAQYNALVALRNRVQNAWADVEAHLKRRWDLIPNLVETVRGYMKHERHLLEEVTRARAQATAGTGPGEIAPGEGMLTRALRQLFAVAENYPDLKANQNFLDLQSQLADIERDLLMARRYYNAVARDYNIRREQFPGNIVARLFGFAPAEYFDIPEAEEARPEVSFDA